MEASAGRLNMIVGDETLTVDTSDFRPLVGSPIVVLTWAGAIERATMLEHHDTTAAIGIGACRYGYLSETQTRFGLQRDMCIILGRIVAPAEPLPPLNSEA